MSISASVTSRNRAHQFIRPAAAILSIIILSVILLRLQGRFWICECGRIDLWAGNTKSSDNSQHILDPYSFTHVLHGFLFYGLTVWLFPRWSVGWKLWASLTVEAAWEVIENSAWVIQRYREATLALGYSGDTIINSLGDLLCCAAGFYLARKLGFRRSLVVFLITEVILVVWIRDSLILNIIQLLYPFDAIKNWQLGQ